MGQTEDYLVAIAQVMARSETASGAGSAQITIKYRAILYRTQGINLWIGTFPLMDGTRQSHETRENYGNLAHFPPSVLANPYFIESRSQLYRSYTWHLKRDKAA